jgi:hypothetical protein
MKSSIFTAITVFVLSISGFSFAQNGVNNRISPMDSVMTNLNDLQVEIVYSRPFLKGREFGKDIVPYGKVWRTGANEATTFEISRDVMINNQSLAAGKYSLYTIPNADKTVVIFNKVWDQWGTQYDENFDALRVEVPTNQMPEEVEQFTIEIEPTGKIEFLWDNVEFGFDVKKI